MANAKTEWFVEPLDAHTNEVISREVASYELSEERNVRLPPRTGKPPINLWRCQHLFIERLRGSRRDLDLRFRVYSRRGSAGPVRLTNIPTSRQRLSRKVLEEAAAITRRVRRRAS